MATAQEQRVAVPIDDPNADTEWNDILRQHGVIPQRAPSPTPVIEEAILEARHLAHANRLEGKDLDELDELEDEEDEAFLEEYKQRRMGELKALEKKSIHGSVYPISKPEYTREVTDASINEGGVVLVNLQSSASNNVESRVLSEIWRQAAREYGEIKFCEMRADKAVENYPDRNCPTILVYRNGDIVKNVVTLAQWGGARMMTMQRIDELLVEVGAVSDMDQRITRRQRSIGQDELEKSSGQGRSQGEDADEDSD